MYIYKANEIQTLDKKAGQEGLATFTLMESAGHAIYRAIAHRLKADMRVLILSGKGNNGGDGIVLARLLKNDGFHVELVFPLGMPESETAKQHYGYFCRLGYEAKQDITGTYDLIFDALLGIGVRRPIGKAVREWIDWINRAEGYKIAIDIPTGVQADDGQVEAGVHADETLCLHGFKPSVFLQPSIDYYGKTQCLSIGLPQTSQWCCWQEIDVQRSYYHRNENAHKGSFGTGLLLAGMDDIPGCAVLSAKAALRSGIGKLTVATSKNVRNIIASHLLECSYHSMNMADVQMEKEINWKQFQAIAIGPGLDDLPYLEQLVTQAIASHVPLVLDAAALSKRIYPKRKGMIVLTPHPKEMSRLTGLEVTEIQANRLEVASQYAIQQGVAVVLKGRKTICAFPSGHIRVIETGNVSLAKGGTGDTLTGILLAFLSYYSDYEAAICNAVYLHGLCADMWREKFSTAAMLASDLSEWLPEALKVFERSGIK